MPDGLQLPVRQHLHVPDGGTTHAQDLPATSPWCQPSRLHRLHLPLFYRSHRGLEHSFIQFKFFEFWQIYQPWLHIVSQHTWEVFLFIASWIWLCKTNYVQTCLWKQRMLTVLYFLKVLFSNLLLPTGGRCVSADDLFLDYIRDSVHRSDALLHITHVLHGGYLSWLRNIRSNIALFQVLSF